ncbi:melanocyte-stimulating hormone receptor-like [Clytia hemisphaerica]|uniref:G-protein coupled receptors family 1 profile domain-containing protein n=1 Tax=Clytia hemisphaerica TaxID=252671 RepID=A0A7M5X3R4_9CNID
MDTELNVTSCDDILHIIHPWSNDTTYFHFMLPIMCQLFNNTNASMITLEEQVFDYHCCKPFVINGKTDIFEYEQPFNLCNYLNLTVEDGRLYYTFCGVDQNFQLSIIGSKWRLLTIIVLALLAPIGLFTNSLILYTYYKIQRLRNATGHFISHLIISNLLTITKMMLTVIIYGSSVGMNNASSQVHLIVMPSINLSIGSAFLLHTTAVSIERAIAVSTPLKHFKYVNRRRAKRCILAIWIYCLAILVMGLLQIPIVGEIYFFVYIYLIATLSVLIPFLLFVISYSFIMVSACRNIRNDKKKHRNAQPTHNAGRLSRVKELKVALNVAIMTIPLIFGWNYFMGNNIYAELNFERITGFHNWLAPFVPFIISCVNPLIYIAFTRSLRTHSKKIITAWYASLKNCFCNRSSHAE